MTKTPRGERLIIVIVGKRNVGKSSLINAITEQDIAIVSEIAGTTTDPVAKHYELLPLGPVTLYDTAGIDDVGELGLKRIKATNKILYRADIITLVIGNGEIDDSEERFIFEIKDMKVPMLIVFNKSDLVSPNQAALAFCDKHSIEYCSVSTQTLEGITACKELIIKLSPQSLKSEKPLIGDLVKAGDHVILVTPIDLAAPKGRLILPQVQVIRELLDNDTIVTVVKERELEHALESIRVDPNLVVTDSQAILKVAGDVPLKVPITTFSILFARYKGELSNLLNGASMIDRLNDGDKILIAESCSHHIQCDDIGRVKIPRWLNQYTGLQLTYEVFAGHDLPDNLEDYSLVIHCGACMINQAEMHHRMLESQRRGVPITNYGMIISKVQGLLERVIQIFGI